MLYLISILNCTSTAKFSTKKKPTVFYNHTHKAHPKPRSILNTAKCNNINCLQNTSLETIFLYITCHVCLHPKPQQIHRPRSAFSVPSPSGQESNLLRSLGSVSPVGWLMEWEICCTRRPFQQSRLIWSKESDLKIQSDENSRLRLYIYLHWHCVCEGTRRNKDDDENEKINDCL